MITKTLTMLFSIALISIAEVSKTEDFIPINIEFCDSNKAFEKSICSIRHAVTLSYNKVITSNWEKTIYIIIDKRTITPEKAAAIFANGSVVI